MKTNNKGAKSAAKNIQSSTSAMKPKSKGLHPSRIDLSEKIRVQICEILNQSLADTLDLTTQIKQAHWNVKGVHFYQLHLLFDEIAGEFYEYVDLFAERITSLGGTAFGTTRMAARTSRLPDFPTDISEGMDFVAVLSDRFAQYAKVIRHDLELTGDIGDLDTQDVYTEVSRQADKRLWFLEAHLQAASAERETTHTRVAAKPKR